MRPSGYSVPLLQSYAFVCVSFYCLRAMSTAMESFASLRHKSCVESNFEWDYSLKTHSHRLEWPKRGSGT